MFKNFRLALGSATVVAVLLSGTAFYAYPAETQSSPGRGAMMDGTMHGQGGMPGMMSMMQQMNQMMDACNTMMKEMHQQRGVDTPKEHKAPSQQKLRPDQTRPQAAVDNRA